MHRNIARAYDCLQHEHDCVRAACVKILAQNDKCLERELLGQTSTVHDTTTKSFFTRSAYPDPSSVAFLI